MAVSAPVGEPGDLAIQTRLLTSGDISEGSDVSYEVNVSNIGAGDIYSDQVGLYYLLSCRSRSARCC
ncbi:MAG: hypothetical protein U0R17_05805 [Acidimicrobiia bacterium]